MTGACAVAQPVRPVTKIGLAAPFEGQYRYVGYEAMYAARLALREANATGGVGGYSVELVAYDDHGTADGARTAARNLVLDPSVGAVIGHFRDESNEVAQVLYDSAGLPTINAGSVDGFGDHQGNLICLFLLRLAHETSDEGQGAAPGSAANRMLGPVHVQWVTDNEALPRCDDRLSFTASSQFPPADDTDVVFLALGPVEAAETLRALRDVDWHGTVAGGPSLGSPLFAQVGDPEGVVFASLYRWPDLDDRDATFAARYASLGPHVPTPGPVALSTYEAMRRLLAEIGQVAADGLEPTRHNLAPDVSPQPLDSLFVYRWAESGAPEFIDQLPIAE
jgi:ABC-type branched-subunit amino acid transport system substrate-binding protein